MVLNYTVSVCMLHKSHSVLTPLARLAWDCLRALPKTCVLLAGVSASSQSPLAEQCENNHTESKFWLGAFFMILLFSLQILYCRTRSEWQYWMARTHLLHVHTYMQACTAHTCMNALTSYRLRAVLLQGVHVILPDGTWVFKAIKMINKKYFWD